MMIDDSGKVLKSKYALDIHIAVIHKQIGRKSSKTYLCNICGHLSNNRTDYDKHRNKVFTDFNRILARSFSFNALNCAKNKMTF